MTTRPSGMGIQNREINSDLENIDITEKGRSPSGEVLTSTRRLYMQFLAFGDVKDSDTLIWALESSKVQGALYEDVNDARVVALLTYSETPEYFVDELRAFLNQKPFAELAPKPEYTMLGRSYAIGYEPDLDEALITRPRNRVLDPELKWAIWYPLRRSGSFEQLTAQEQNVILAEHGGIGRAFGRAHLGYDVRLACHGLDKNDNDFVIGLIGPELTPLS